MHSPSHPVDCAMRAVLLATWLVAMASAMVTSELNEERLVSMDSKKKQIVILKLLNHILQPTIYKDIEEIAKNFEIEENIHLFVKTEVVKDFTSMFKYGLLPRGEVFTLHIDRQLKEVINMFHLLYYAKDFDSFVKTAAWMRVNLNEGMFVYALTVAVRHREDCKGIILPPPYEIYPYYFVRGDVIQKAYMLKMQKGLLDDKISDFYGIKKVDKDTYVIDENIYDKRVALNEEDRLKYFTEDIDLNTYYYYFHIDYPFWMRENIFDKLKMRPGEVTIYTYQQILARHKLERLSNGLDDLPVLSLNKPVEKGYWPWLMLHNGVQLPVRPNNYIIPNDDNTNILHLVEDYESIIKEAILKGYININGVRLELTKTEDIDILGKLIYSKINNAEDVEKKNTEAYRYLLIIMKSVLGLNTINSDKYFVVPTVLDQYETALRDPIFYQLQKRLIDLVALFKARLPSYTKEELYFPGVRIDNVVVDKLVTYFDDYLLDITNAVILTDEELKKGSPDMSFLVRKNRLNHLPFKINLDIISDKAVDAVIRIFLGPKEDNLGRLVDINKNRLDFIEFDSFLYKLNVGKNSINRDSKDIQNIVGDRIMTHDLLKKLDSLSDTRDLLKTDLKNYHTGFPSRLLLPKGTTGGLKMMFYVIVTPLKMVDNIDLSITDIENKDMQLYLRSILLLDKMPLGFPLDRFIDTSKFYTPNMKFVDVIIFHKKQVCDMKTHFDRWVLRNYNLVGINSIESNTRNLGDDNIYTHVERNLVNL